MGYPTSPATRARRCWPGSPTSRRAPSPARARRPGPSPATATTSSTAASSPRSTASPSRVSSASPSSAMAPNKVGPRDSTGLIPAVATFKPGEARVSWPAEDRDDETLTYQVFRDFQSLNDTPIFTTTADDTFWQTGQGRFTDTGLTPGKRYAYRVYASTRPATPQSSWRDGHRGRSPSACRKSLRQRGSQRRCPKFWPLGRGLRHERLRLGGLRRRDRGRRGHPRRCRCGTSDADTASTFDGSNGLVVDPVAIPGPEHLHPGGVVQDHLARPAARSSASATPPRATPATTTGTSTWTASGRVYFGVYPGNRADGRVSAAGLNDGQWHQVVATLGSDGMALYIDGKRVATRSGHHRRPGLHGLLAHRR